MTAAATVDRRLPIGAEYRDGQTHFRIWAPKHPKLTLIFEKGHDPIEMERDNDGYFSAVAEVGPGSNYKFKLPSGDAFPDPASRYQPQGVHAWSQVVDPDSFKWTDGNWKGVPAFGQVLYEFHVGAFTPQGTWVAAAEKLQYLKDVGITCLEMMPVNEFPGDHGWGYDGVSQYAPYHKYGTPDDLKRFIDKAHSLGLGVILDLVYNHLGPEGNYLPTYSDDYFSRKHATDWGGALNYDANNSKPVREYFVNNVKYWIGQFHFDGIRFDATQAIMDDTKPYILQEAVAEGRKAAGNRSIYVINENEPQDTKLVRPIDQGGYGMDGLWNDDFHHTAMVALTGRNEAYYHDYLGTPQELISVAKHGYLFQGTRCAWQSKRRGTPTRGLKPTAFVSYLQNHDQIANSGHGLRAHVLSSPAGYRAVTAYWLLCPQTPMFFMGQEFAASCRFFYFSDYQGELKEAIKKGRAHEVAQFPSVATPAMQAQLADPGACDTFMRSKLDWNEVNQPPHTDALNLHRDLLKLRREDPILVGAQKEGMRIDGAVLGHGAFVLRFLDPAGTDDRLLLVNLGNDLSLDRPPEPLLAPPLNGRWKVIFNSEDPRYGGAGGAHPDTEDEGWFLTARSAMLLAPASADEASVQTRIVAKSSAQAAKTIDESEDASPT